MSSPSTPPPEADDSFYMSWGLLAGAGLGLVIGLATGRWLAWPCALGAAGFIVGALLDRRRRG